MGRAFDPDLHRRDHGGEQGGHAEPRQHQRERPAVQGLVSGPQRRRGAARRDSAPVPLGRLHHAPLHRVDGLGAHHDPAAGAEHDLGDPGEIQPHLPPRGSDHLRGPPGRPEVPVHGPLPAEGVLLGGGPAGGGHDSGPEGFDRGDHLRGLRHDRNEPRCHDHALGGHDQAGDRGRAHRGHRHPDRRPGDRAAGARCGRGRGDHHPRTPGDDGLLQETRGDGKDPE